MYVNRIPVLGHEGVVAVRLVFKDERCYLLLEIQNDISTSSLIKPGCVLVVWGVLI